MVKGAETPGTALIWLGQLGFFRGQQKRVPALGFAGARVLRSNLTVIGNFRCRLTGLVCEMGPPTPSPCCQHVLCHQPATLSRAVDEAVITTHLCIGSFSDTDNNMTLSAHRYPLH